MAICIWHPPAYAYGTHLQNLDWKADPEIVKNIVNFYSKAKALEMLAAFFDSCAQVEIDDCRDYEKAPYLPTHLLTCLLTCLLTYLLAYLLT